MQLCFMFLAPSERCYSIGPCSSTPYFHLVTYCMLWISVSGKPEMLMQPTHSVSTVKQTDLAIDAFRLKY